ncbi:DUF2834 domain-containing protein [Gordonia malaquae]|uniref:DUF2834 domain-containing protein n=1 Tax=Gordonia malaquae TaxID=410332 RepID=UPI003BF8B29D
MTVTGFLVPTAIFGRFFILSEGNGLKKIRQALADATATLPASGIFADATLTATTFVTWAAWDARQHEVKRWWLIYPATFGVGISFGAPLYLLLREYALGERVGIRAA